jgi:NAD(P)H dehydrogenase (quinone)
MIAITAASGQLGRLVVEGLLARKVPAKDLVAVVRAPSKVQDLAQKGVQVRQGDYDQPKQLEAALAGVDTLLLISASELGKRLPQHQNALAAASAAKVKLLAYTSLLHADTSTLGLAAEHKATEEAIRASGVPFVFLRNGWYFENHTGQIPTALKFGTFLGSAKDGRIASALRADYAAAAVEILTTQGHAGKTYELAGDAAFTMKELAAEVSRQSGKTVTYTDLPVDAFKKALVEAKLPAFVADLYADFDVNIAKGVLDDSSKTLSRLLGRPTTTLEAAVKAALATAR